MSYRPKQLSPLNDVGATPIEANWQVFPKTRYLGSKRKLLPVLVEVFGELGFATALDAFTGTGSVAYLLKTMGKEVTATDILESNAIMARALVENDEKKLGNKAIELVNGIPDSDSPPGFVEQTFEGIFYEPEENRFIDSILTRINNLAGFQRDIALFALFQASLAKRPYNLFHRANLYMRQRDVERTFGNKTTWDRPFGELFVRFAEQADEAVFRSELHCSAFRSDVLEVDPHGFDLVYLDPPYVSANGSGVDYLDYYHFLEGLASPEGWSEKILHKYKHKPLLGRGGSPWCSSKLIERVFEETISRFRKSTIVISYRSDGIPSVETIVRLLKKLTGRASIVDAGKYTYALSNNKESREVVLVGG